MSTTARATIFLLGFSRSRRNANSIITERGRIVGKSAISRRRAKKYCGEKTKQTRAEEVEGNEGNGAGKAEDVG